ncbi:putative cilia- and flagella-associated protein 65 [Blattamonas nauphoetae]|uniref:Cilia- and flagella-associated protein 65 n=1 Tax=Blattamonas nauphoetae TaxID=2049346 RepID=A0ABQ9X9P2_9EUKA|nr:putative cilia- and flagella-associated protein 65 [Blattamonas nauphoetae]
MDKLYLEEWMQRYVPMILPAGMSSSVEILFRSIELVPCEEQISFKCVKGTFSIPLIATVPQLSLSLPEQLDFGLCPINEVSLIDFEVYNNGQIDTEFSFKIPESSPLLTLSLMKGVIHAGKSIIVTAKDTPTDATFLQCLVSCICQDQVRVMSVTAQGKFPFVKASQTEISFGEGRIEANESIRIRVSLNAETHNVKYCDLFRICTPGGNYIQLTCTPHTVGPTVVTDKTVLNFGSLEIGTTTSQSFLITNMTDAQAEFQILADETGFFNVNCVQAILPACSAANNFKTITVTFHPLVCMNYHKRLIILVKFLSLPTKGYINQKLECMCYLKYLRSYTLSTGRTKIPPWCLTVSCIGRRIKSSDFIPVAKLEPESLYFPPTIPRRSTYHTIKFTNEGDMTLLFDTRGNQNRSFLVSPTSACIPPNSFCLLAVSFQPSILRSNPPLKGNAQFNPQPFKEIETMGGPTRYKVHRPPEENTFDLILKANASIGETYSSLLVGVVNHPGLCFENDHVVMRAACIGSYSKRQIKLRNPSRMSICVCVGLYQGEIDLRGSFTERYLIAS